jgi:hypothetical protein
MIASAPAVGLEDKTRENDQLSLAATEARQARDYQRKDSTTSEAVGLLRRALWFARPLPVRVSDACIKEFVSALVQAHKAHDLLFDSNGGATALLVNLWGR